MAEIVQSPEVLRLLDELTRMEGRADPYPRYARLREISPIVRADDNEALALLAKHYNINTCPICGKAWCKCADDVEAIRYLNDPAIEFKNEH